MVNTEADLNEKPREQVYYEYAYIFVCRSPDRFVVLVISD
ncbi:MAG: hypothetical protein RHS_2362 [Robinsoniella sp. RHS]|nr:MAG: hypothetical protein RHS_2362 [Robinsoniella sp. RHS]